MRQDNYVRLVDFNGGILLIPNMGTVFTGKGEKGKKQITQRIAILPVSSGSGHIVSPLTAHVSNLL